MNKSGIREANGRSPGPGITGTRQRIGVAADDGGFGLMQYLAGKLSATGHQVINFGALRATNDCQDFVAPLARAVSRGEVKTGVAICGSGDGASFSAYRVIEVRACLIDERSRERQGAGNDDLNVICLGGRVVGHALAWDLVQSFLAEKFGGMEHQGHRVAEVADQEGGP